MLKKKELALRNLMYGTLLVACTVTQLVVADPDPASSCSRENVERCRESGRPDCLKVFGLLCAQAGHLALKGGHGQHAKAFLNRACRLDVADACYVLGGMELASEERSRARVYFLTGCQLESDKSCNALLKMGGRDADLAEVSSPKPELNALGTAWLKTNMDVQIPCQDINADACYAQGTALAKEGRGQEALAALKIACEKQHSTACNRVGWELKLEKRLGEAAAFFEKACRMGERVGCNNLGWQHEKSFRMDLARRYYAEACQLGHQKACVRRDELSR